jgi:hypothetical protein
MKCSFSISTSISIREDQKEKLETCCRELEVSTDILLGQLCYRAVKTFCNTLRDNRAMEYQERGLGIISVPVTFNSCDHNFIHCWSHCCKKSVSLLLALAIDLFLDEIMAKGINHVEIIHLRNIEKNSYRKPYEKSFSYMQKIEKNGKKREYKMKLTRRTG